MLLSKKQFDHCLRTVDEPKHSILGPAIPLFSRLSSDEGKFEYMDTRDSYSTEHRGGQRLEQQSCPDGHIDQLSCRRGAGGMFCTVMEACRNALLQVIFNCSYLKCNCTMHDVMEITNGFAIPEPYVIENRRMPLPGS